MTNFPWDGWNGILLLAGAALAGLILSWILTAVLTKIRILKQSPADGNTLLRRHLRTPLRALLPAVFLYPALHLIALPDIAGNWIRHGSFLWILITGGWTVMKVVSLIGDLVQNFYKLKDKDNLKARQVHTQILVLERIAHFAIIILTLSLSLMTFDRVQQIGYSLLASAGVIGIIMGFAAQKSIGTLFYGIQIALTQPIRLDDIVIVEGEFGWIEEITLTYAVVRIWDQRRLVVPISFFIEKPFQNWTRSTSEILGTAFFHVDFKTPIQLLRTELERLVKESANWDGKACNLQVTDMTEKSLVVRAMMSAESAPKAWDLRVEIREKMLAFLQSRPEFLPLNRMEVRDSKTTKEIV